MLGTELILTVCVYPFLFIMYFLVKNEGGVQKTGCFGITLTKDNMKEPEAAKIIKEYNKQMRRTFIALLLAPLPMLFIPWFSIYLTFWMVWLIGGIFAFFIPFGRANTKLKDLKREKGWKKDGEEKQTLVEMKSAGKVRRVKWYQFAGPCAISIALFVWALIRFHGEKLEALSAAVGSLAFVTVLFYIMAVWMDRQKTQVISEDSEVNLNYTRAKKNLWKNLWTACAWVNTAYTACMLFSLGTDFALSGLFFWGTAAYILVTIALLFGVIKKRRNIDKAYADKMDIVLTDDDDNWLWGMIYYNPKDKHVMVEKRVGIGTTMNMATKAGKGMGIFCGLMLLSLPLVCFWCILLEFTPIQLSVTDGRLMASQIKADYSVPVSIMEDITLLEELPKWSKVNGTGMENLQKGTFRIAEVGSCRVFLNPENKVFIRFTAAGETYYMSGYDDAETLQVYEILTSQ